MQEERDTLTKVVFPALRERLVPFRIRVDEIDLRWGVTREQAEDGRVLEICLALIDESRPYFLGILGDRYGSVIEELSADQVAAHTWIDSYENRSLTELEMIYAVLQAPGKCPLACFYLREPSPSTQSQKTEKVSYEQERLASLRRRIVNSGVLVRKYNTDVLSEVVDEAHTDLDSKTFVSRLKRLVAGVVYALHRQGNPAQPEEERSLPEQVEPEWNADFAAKVEDDLWEAIVQQEQLDLSNVPHESYPYTNVHFDDRFVQERLHTYVHRTALEDTIRDFITGNECLPLAIVGAPGTGKSALLSAVYRLLRQHEPETHIFAHFVGAGPHSDNLSQMLKRLCREIGLLVSGRPEQGDRTPDLPTELNQLVSQAREQLNLATENRRLVLLIDGFDQLKPTDGPTLLSWLPVPCEQLRVVVSCIESLDQDPRPVLTEIRTRGWSELEVGPLSPEQVKQILHIVPSVAAKTLDFAQKECLLANPETRNPLYLIIALEELRYVGGFDEVDHRIAAMPKKAAIEKNLAKAGFSKDLMSCANGVPLIALYLQVIDRLAKDYGMNLCRIVLVAFAQARFGLSERELATVVASVDSEKRFFPLLRQLLPYLVTGGETLAFSHDSFQVAIENLFIASENEKTKGADRLVAYFESQDDFAPCSELDSGSSTGRGAPNRRKLEELIPLLTLAEDWHGLLKLFDNYTFLEAASEGNMLVEVTSDLSDALGQMPGWLASRHRLQLIHNALTRSIGFLNRHPKMLFSALWDLCWWYDHPDAAEHYQQPQTVGLKEAPWNRVSNLFATDIYDMRMRASEQLYPMLEIWRSEKGRSEPGFAWLRTLTPPIEPLESPLITTLRGHAGPVNSVATSPDGHYIVSSNWVLTEGDNEVKVWDARTGVELRQITMELRVWAVAFAADSRTVAVADSLHVYIMDIYGELTTLLETKIHPRTVCFHPSSQILVAGGLDGILVIRLDEPSEPLLLSHHKFFSACYSPDGSMLATGGLKGNIELWDTQTYSSLGSLKGHDESVMSLDFSPDSRCLVSGSGNSDPDAETLDPTIRIWNVESRQEIGVISQDDPVTAVSFSPNGQLIASANQQIFNAQRDVWLWDALSLAPVGSIRGHRDEIHSIAWLRPNQRVVSSSGGLNGDYSIRIWQPENSTTPKPKSFRSDIRGLGFSPRGSLLAASALAFSEMRLYDTQTGLLIHDLRGHTERIRCFNFSRDELFIASGSGSEHGGLDCTIRIWDTTSGECIRVLSTETLCGTEEMSGYVFAVIGVYFSNDGRRVTSAHSNFHILHEAEVLRMWDFETGKLIDAIPASYVEPDPQKRIEGSVGLYLVLQRFCEGHAYDLWIESHALMEPKHPYRIAATANEVVVSDHDFELASLPLETAHMLAISPLQPVFAVGVGSNVVLFALEFE